MSHTASCTRQNKLILGGGCFWCLEAIFLRIDGVIKVTSGYAGGASLNPDYHQICQGNTGHAEVIEIVYDNKQINIETLLSVFFATHDPTTLNRQGNDRGTQYRSIIFYSDRDEEEQIKQCIEQNQKEFDKKIVTQVVPIQVFYPAEIEHHNYYALNSSQAYCQMVIKPKLNKLIEWKTNQS